MKSTACRYFAVALAVTLAVGVSTSGHCDDTSTDIAYGGSDPVLDSGHNLPYGNLGTDKWPWAVVVTDTSDLTPNAPCGPLTDRDPFWQSPFNGAATQEEPTMTSPGLHGEPAPLFQAGPPAPFF